MPSTSQACLTDKALAYVRNSGTPARTDIILRLLDSGSETIPTASLPGTSQHPRWSDDGCALYFAYRKPDTGEKYHIWMLKGAQITQVSSNTTDDIWLMKNAQITQLTASPTDDEVDPDSAGGSKLVFVGEKGHLKILDTLSSPDFLGYDTPGWEGVLKHGIYRQRKGLGVDESVMWGEYFFVEALIKALDLLGA